MVRRKKTTPKKADNNVTLQSRKPKSPVTVERNTGDGILSPKANDSYAGYIIPRGETALVQFPFEKGTGHIWITPIAGGELGVLPALHCAPHVEVTAFAASDAPGVHTRKVKD